MVHEVGLIFSGVRFEHEKITFAIVLEMIVLLVVLAGHLEVGLFATDAQQA